MLRRIIMLVTVGLVMAAMMLAMAMPAFAAANENANCIGELASGDNQLGPGQGGQQVAIAARTGGSAFGHGASTNCGQSTD